MSNTDKKTLAEEFVHQAHRDAVSVRNSRGAGWAEEGIKKLEPLEAQGEDLGEDDPEVVAARIQVLLALSSCYSFTKDQEARRARLIQANTLNPRHPEVLRTMADMYFYDGRYEDALACLDEITIGREGRPPIDPRDKRAWAQLGILCKKMRWFEESKKCFLTIVQGINGQPPIDPKDHRAWTSLANAYRHERNYPEAIRCLQRIVEGVDDEKALRPYDRFSWDLLREIYGINGQFEKARECALKVEALDAQRLERK